MSDPLANYSIGVLYGSKSLANASEVLGAVGEMLESLRVIASDLSLIQQGLLFYDRLEVKNVRRAKFSTRRLVDWSSRVGDAREAAFYVSDSKYDDKTPAVLMCNVHLSAHSTIDGIPVRFGTEAVNLFVIVAAERAIPVSFDQFSGRFRQLFLKCRGVRGGLWCDSTEKFNESTSFEWAHRNITSKIPGPDRDVQSWDPRADVILNRPGFPGGSFS